MDVPIRFDRGAMIAMNTRWVNMIVNRLRPADDGDILVPVGTVCVLGTTSVQTDHPDDYRIEAWEVSKILGSSGCRRAGDPVRAGAAGVGGSSPAVRAARGRNHDDALGATSSARSR